MEILSEKDINELLDIINSDEEFFTDHETFQNECNDILKDNISVSFNLQTYSRLYDLSRKLMCVYPNSLLNKDKTREYYFIEAIQNVSTESKNILLLNECYEPLLVTLEHFAHEFFNADLNSAIEYINKREKKAHSDDIVETHSKYGKVFKDKNGNMWSVKGRTKEDIKEFSKGLKNCKDCYECYKCEDCVECYKCENCIDCKNCKKCEYCEHCLDCYDCFSCAKCDELQASENCIECKNSDYLTHCSNCENCVDCHNSKNLKTQGGIDNNEL